MRKIKFKDFLNKISLNNNAYYFIKIISNNKNYYTKDINIYPIEYMNYKVISINLVKSKKEDLLAINKKFKTNKKILCLLEVKLCG